MTDLYVSTRTAAYPGGNAVGNTYVSLHLNNVPLATGTTDEDGLVFLGNRAAGVYEIRVTPATGLVVDGGRKSLTIAADDPDPVVFDVLIDESGVTPPADSRFCRCWGYFKDPTGRPYRDAVLTFSERALPQILRDTVTDLSIAMLPKVSAVVTDADGYASIDLLRGGQYTAMVSPMANTVVDVVIPDLPTASLPDVLFAVVDRVEYKLNDNVLTPTSAPTLSVSVGDTVELAVETVYRSGYRTGGLRRVSLFVEDDDKIKLSLTTSGNLAIQALAPGSATIEVRRSETKEKTIYPEPTPKGFLSVTIVP